MKHFVVVEGIDASGKTTIAKIVVDLLRDSGYSAALLSKRHPKFSDPELADYAETLQRLIWHEQRETPLSFLKISGWALQLSLWYTFLYNNYIKTCDSDFVIMDGWFYKLYCRIKTSAEHDQILSDALLLHLDKATHIYLLDVDPQVCWTRRQTFKDTEIAPFGVTCAPEDAHISFINYQTLVAANLKKLAQDGRWHVCVCDAVRTPDEIALEIVQMIIGGIVHE